MTARSKRKGANAEREVRNELREHLGEIVERTGYQQAHRGGFDLTLPNLGMEVKRHARIRDGEIRAFWEQTMEQSRDHGVVGVLAYREDSQKWRFVCPAMAVVPDEGIVVLQGLELACTYLTPGFVRWYTTCIQPEPEELKLRIH